VGVGGIVGLLLKVKNDNDKSELIYPSKELLITR
jgi:hypothetical protein